jgi:multisubunit Na+/H+ antiporter MnhC subunit
MNTPLCSASALVAAAIKFFASKGLTALRDACFSRLMTQRSNHSQIAIAKPQGQALVLRAALVALATVALITVLVLITGSISAEYGFV